MANADDMFGELLQVKKPSKSLSEQKKEVEAQKQELEKTTANSDLIKKLGYLDAFTEFAGVDPEVKKQIEITEEKTLVKKNDQEIKEAKQRKSKVNGVKNYLKVHSYRNKLGLRPHDFIGIIRRYAENKTDFGEEAKNTPVRYLCNIIQEDFSKFKYWVFQNYK